MLTCLFLRVVNVVAVDNVEAGEVVEDDPNLWGQADDGCACVEEGEVEVGS